MTVKDLLAVADLSLVVVAGSAGLERPIRWVHTSELQDPTPWLSGGELLLTTGMGLRGSPALQRAYMRRLIDAGVAGLGFGIGLGFEGVPSAVLKAADAGGFPVLEVPYPVPFIAIAEAVSTHLTEDRLRDAQVSVEVHERLASLVVQGAGPADVLDEVVALAGGWALLFDLSGRAFARSQPVGTVAPEPDAVWASLPAGLADRTGPQSSSDLSPGGTQVAYAVMGGRRSEGVLAFGKQGRLDQRDRMVVHHAVTVLGLLLASRRAVIDAERRVAGDILGEAFAGRVSGTDLERRLELIGFSGTAPVTALVVDVPPATKSAALEEVMWSIDSILSPRAKVVRTSLIAERPAALFVHSDPEALAEELARELESWVDPSSLGVAMWRVGVGETVEPAQVRQSYLAAVFALRAGPPDARAVSPRHLGSYGLLLGGQPRPIIEGFVRSVIGVLVDRDRDRSSDLVESVRAYVEAGGRWESGAETLGVHRHTLRYRVRKAEELLGRDLSNAEDRLEVWLALKALDILEH